MRPRLPEVEAAGDTGGLAAFADAWRLDVLLDPGADASIGDAPLDRDVLLDLDRDVLLVVGPEGGIDEAELERHDAAGAVRAPTGDHALRASTAGLAGIAALSVRLGRW